MAPNISEDRHSSSPFNMSWQNPATPPVAHPPSTSSVLGRHWELVVSADSERVRRNGASLWRSSHIAQTDGGEVALTRRKHIQRANFHSWVSPREPIRYARTHAGRYRRSTCDGYRAHSQSPRKMDNRSEPMMSLHSSTNKTRQGHRVYLVGVNKTIGLKLRDSHQRW